MKPFLRNVAVVAGGTALAQLITIAFSPIIARIYGPEAFGLQGLFMAFSGILLPLGGLAYSKAVTLPREAREAWALVKLSCFIALAVSVSLYLPLLLFTEEIAGLVGLAAAPALILLAPISVLASGCAQSIEQWCIREKSFLRVARVRVIISTVQNVGKTSAGLHVASGGVLIAVSIVSQCLQGLVMARGARGDAEQARLSFAESVELLRRYRDFPIYRVPQGIVSGASLALPTLMFGALFGVAAAGFYTLTRTILSLPGNLVGQAIGSVLAPRLAEAAHSGEAIRPLLIRTTLGLFLLGALPFGFIVAFGPPLFALVFGDEWFEAGVYSQWVAIWAWSRFVNTATVQAIPVLGLQGWLLAFEVASTGLRVLALAVGAWVLENDVDTLMVFSLVGVFLNVCMIWFILGRSRSSLRKDLRQPPISPEGNHT